MAVVNNAPQLTPGVFGRMMAGVAGGLSGGVVFGVVMQLGGTIPVVAQLVGRESWAAGWTVHMSIAAFVGLTFALIFGFFAVGPPVSTLLGAFYGLIWWVLGGLTLMPLRLGLGLFVFDSTAWESLVGHLAYGTVLGVVYAVVAQLLLNARAGRPAGQPPPALPAPAAPALAYPAPIAPAWAPPALPRSPLAAPALPASAPLPIERSPAPPPPAQPSILEFVLPPVQSSSAPPATPAGAGLTPLPPEARALRQRPGHPPDAFDPASDAALDGAAFNGADPAAADLDGADAQRRPELNPWDVRHHRGQRF